MWKSPFKPSTSKPGHGTITLTTLPPNTPVLRDLTYQYPLKLIAPDPVRAPLPSKTATSSSVPRDVQDDATPSHPKQQPLVHTIFLLTYGGGIVAGDTVSLSITISPSTRLNLLTQGSTKVFKTPDPKLISYQHLDIDMERGSSLCYLPDPVQMFCDAAFVQRNTVRFNGYEGKPGGGGGGINSESDYNLCLLDWVSGGRSARGENWDFYSYESRNEIWTSPISTCSAKTKNRLLLRDMLLLHPPVMPKPPNVPETSSYAIYATLIIHGALFSSLAEHFIHEFEALPRLGIHARTWANSDTFSNNGSDYVSDDEKLRVERQERERRDGVIWTAARVRGFVVVKFAAREVEGARAWVRDMVVGDGTVVREFGERGVLCLK